MKKKAMSWLSPLQFMLMWRQDGPAQPRSLDSSTRKDERGGGWVQAALRRFAVRARLVSGRGPNLDVILRGVRCLRAEQSHEKSRKGSPRLACTPGFV